MSFCWSPMPFCFTGNNRDSPSTHHHIFVRLRYRGFERLLISNNIQNSASFSLRRAAFASALGARNRLVTESCSMMMRSPALYISSQQVEQVIDIADYMPLHLAVKAFLLAWEGLFSAAVLVPGKKETDGRSPRCPRWTRERRLVAGWIGVGSWLPIPPGHRAKACWCCRGVG